MALFMGYMGMPAEQVAGMRRAPFWEGMEAFAPTLAYDHGAITGKDGAIPTDLAASVLHPRS